MIRGKPTETGYQKIRNSCTIYIALFVILFFIIISISSAYIYCYWYLKKYNANITNIANTETVIY